MGPVPRAVVLALAVQLWVLLAGCGTTVRTVRLDTGEGTSFVHTPRRGEEPVRLRQDEFKGAMTELVREVRPVANPLRHARRLMFDSPWQEEVYLRWTGRRLVLDFPGRSA
jgi:hypothetical protein